MKKLDFIWIAVVLMIDQASKFWIASKLGLYESITIIKDFFYITYTQNTGAAFSILEGQMIFFYLVTLAALILLVYYYRKIPAENILLRLTFVLLISGTAGNFIDRLIFRYVRDFLHFRFFGYDFAIFNVADAALSIGVVLLLMDAFLEDRKQVK